MHIGQRMPEKLRRVPIEIAVGAIYGIACAFRAYLDVANTLNGFSSKVVAAKLNLSCASRDERACSSSSVFFR